MEDQMRIVLLGKTGCGKSSSGNTILGDSARKKFLINTSPNSVTSKCEVLTGRRAGKEAKIEIIDTPGFFDTIISDKETKREIVKCIVTCAPGPHAFLIVLSVGRFTVQERETVAEITRSFGEDAFKYSAVLFTEGDRLAHDQTIEQFVKQSEELKKLVGKCGGGCHVIDNKYWNQEHQYRSNRVQVENLLNTIEEMITQNGGGCYTNEMLQAVEGAIQRLIREMKSRAEAVRIVMDTLLVECEQLKCGVLIGALLGTATAEVVLFSAFAASATFPIAAGVGFVGAVGGGVLGFQAEKNKEVVKKAAWETVENVRAGVKGLALEFERCTTFNEGHNTKKNE